MDNNLRNFYRKHFKPGNICLCLENILFMFLNFDTIYCRFHNKKILDNPYSYKTLSKQTFYEVVQLFYKYSWKLILLKSSMSLLLVLYYFLGALIWFSVNKADLETSQSIFHQNTRNISQQTWNFIHQSSCKLCRSRQIQVFTFF